MITGSRRGLTLPFAGIAGDGPVFIVEGMSDVLALASCRLAVVGRPSATGGAEFLAQALSGLDPARTIVVFGENDRKADDTWPGRDGCDRIANELAKQLPDRTILRALPPEEYKDVREWVCDRCQPPEDASDAWEPDWVSLGNDIARTMLSLAKQVAKAPKISTRPGARFPLPMPVTELSSTCQGASPWVWDGYLARGAVTLFSALPKCGKTTLISHLLQAMTKGGEFLGRSLVPGKAVVISEESQLIWADRRDRIGLTDCVRILTRPFFGKPSPEDWLAFLQHLATHLEGDPADLLVFDTLADLWPVRDENNATDVQTALQPLRRLSDGRAVLCVHHLRKSDGAEGTGSRGSGALAGFVDIIAELRRAKNTIDIQGTKRVLAALGRLSGIPSEWVIELDEEAERYHFVGESGNKAELNGLELRHAIAKVLPCSPPGMTRKEIWDALPEECQVNEVRFRSILEAEAGYLWRKEKHGGQGGGFNYVKLPLPETESEV